MQKKIKRIPQHIGIILDGNRRWARKRSLSTLEGHKRGYERAIEIGEYAFTQGIKYMTLYAFSTENWKRSKYEVGYLMNLMLTMIEQESIKLHEKGIRFKVIGTKRKLSKKILKAIDMAEKLTSRNSKGTLLLAFNYGGRNEIVEAVQDIVVHSSRKTVVTEKMIADHLDTKGVPDPDFIIRTSGEQRISGFLLWQAAYSELYFTRKMWPEFTKAEFDKALAEYGSRKRRFGK